MDRDFAGSWKVSCKVEFDWPIDEPNVYFEVRFYDRDGFQTDYINEIANLKAGRNLVHITGYTEPGWDEYDFFVRS